MHLPHGSDLDMLSQQPAAKMAPPPQIPPHPPKGSSEWEAMQVRKESKKPAAKKTTYWKKTNTATSHKGNTTLKKKGRGPKLTDKEMMSIFDSIEDHSPKGKILWDKIAKVHTKNGWADRGANALKKRYTEYVKKAQQGARTGDPNITEVMRWCRECHYGVRH